MKSTNLLSRIRSALRRGAVDPVGRYGTQFKGTYEPRDRVIAGGVSVLSGYNRSPPAQIVAVKEGDIVASTSQLEPNSTGWRFRLELEFPIMPDDVLRDRITVFALDQHAARSELRIDGSAQLAYLREAFSPPHGTELDIDFSKNGKNRQFLLSGWSGPEPDLTWTEGKESTVAIKFANPGHRYRVELLAWPFTVPDKLPHQTLVVWLADVLIGTFYLGPRQHLIECDVSPELSQTGSTILRLELPDAARPLDLGVNGETRVLALACKRLRLRRQIENSEPADILMARC
jgi:hypothetical protein